MKIKKNFLVFCGTPGRSKTYLCSALIEWIHFNFNSYRIWKDSELYDKVKECIDNNWNRTKQIIDSLDDDLIVLDDFGVSSPTGWYEEFITIAIKYLHDSEKPVIITTNLSKKEIEDNFHTRVSSNIFASCNYIIELHDGFDYRQKLSDE